METKIYKQKTKNIIKEKKEREKKKSTEIILSMFCVGQ